MSAYRPTEANVDMWLRTWFRFPVTIDTSQGTGPLLEIAFVYSDLFRPVTEDEGRDEPGEA